MDSGTVEGWILAIDLMYQSEGTNSRLVHVPWCGTLAWTTVSDLDLGVACLRRAFDGARGGTRTHMSVRTARFKRAASASCATRARPSRYRRWAGPSSGAGQVRLSAQVGSTGSAARLSPRGWCSSAQQPHHQLPGCPQACRRSPVNGPRPSTLRSSHGLPTSRTPLVAQPGTCSQLRLQELPSCDHGMDDKRCLYAATALVETGGGAATATSVLKVSVLASSSSPSPSMASHRADRTRSALESSR